jgi:hypothetical protein
LQLTLELIPNVLSNDDGAASRPIPLPLRIREETHDGALFTPQ